MLGDCNLVSSSGNLYGHGGPTGYEALPLCSNIFSENAP